MMMVRQKDIPREGDRHGYIRSKNIGTVLLYIRFHSSAILWLLIYLPMIRMLVLLM